MTPDQISARANAVRKAIVDIIHASSASHVGSSLSMAEILCAVYGRVDSDKVRDKHPGRDRVVVSKGHAAAAHYAALNSFGILPGGMLATYYRNGSLLGGHSSHRVPGVEHSTGALGHGLSFAVGTAVGLRNRHPEARVYVVTGDGEMHEGSNWEALMLAGHLGLSNLTLLVDANELSGIGCVADCCSLEPLTAKLEAFGFKALDVDGHDAEALCSALDEIQVDPRPGAVVCRTVKGKGVPFMEGNNVWHYRPPGAKDHQAAMEALSGQEG